LAEQTIKRDVIQAAFEKFQQAKNARLLMVTGRSPGRLIELQGGPLILGRSSEVGVMLPDVGVSREHAKIAQNPLGDFVVEDCGSANGTYVNGVEVKKRILRFGDKISIGDTTFLFTQFDELAEKLLQSQRLESMGRLAGGVAHDFNNVLSALLSNIVYLQSGAGQNPNEVKLCLEDMTDAVTRARDLTGQMLSFARSSQGEEEVILVSELIDDVTRLAKRTFGASTRISNECKLGLHVIGDYGQLHQALLNLYMNGRDAMPKGGELVVRTFMGGSEDMTNQPALSGGDYVIIEVKDTGVGIAPNIIGRIFEPFFTTKEAGLGTGLGLATAYGIITNHSGHIEVSSSIGLGSTFRIAIPATSRRKIDERDTKNLRAPVPSSRPMKILIVDDEDLVLRGFSRFLRSLGHVCVCASNGQQAVHLFNTQGATIDLVVLDVSMPGFDGVTTFEHVRRRDPGIPVILTSGHMDDGRVRKLVEENQCGFLLKPVDINAFRAAVDKLEISELT